MSLLKLISDVVDAVGLPRISTVASATDQPARQMLALANEVLDDLARKDWPILEKAYTFNTAIGTVEYAMPSDFKRIISDTMYATGQYYKVRGSLSSSEWQRRRYSALSTIGRYSFKIYGNPRKLVITPTPQVAEPITFEYASTTRVLSDMSVGQPKFLADTDNAVFPDDIMQLGLKWKIRHAKGLEYAQAYNDYQLALQTAFSQEYQLGEMPVAVRSGLDIDLPEGYVRENGYGA